MVQWQLTRVYPDWQAVRKAEKRHIGWSFPTREYTA